jgi:hypothetical protein
MIKVITFEELARLNPERLYWYYRQLSLTLNRTDFGTVERTVLLASIDKVIHAINLYNCDQ